MTTATFVNMRPFVILRFAVWKAAKPFERYIRPLIVRKKSVISLVVGKDFDHAFFASLFSRLRQGAPHARGDFDLFVFALQSPE